MKRKPDCNFDEQPIQFFPPLASGLVDFKKKKKKCCKKIQRKGKACKSCPDY